MLRSIYIDEFRHFKNFKLNMLGPQSLICGLNGSGKSSLLDVIYRLKGFISGSMQIAEVCQIEDIPIWSNAAFGTLLSQFEFSLEVEELKYTYFLAIKHNLRDGLCRVENEKLSNGTDIIFESNQGIANVRDVKFPVDWSVSALNLASRQNQDIAMFIEFVKNNLVVVSLNPSAMNSFHLTPESALQLDGSNFSAWYADKINFDITSVASAFAEFKNFIPGFIKTILSSEGRYKELRVIIGADKQTYEMPFATLSSGQKALFAIYLIMHTARDNSCICIDEFENHLSPVELQPVYDAMQDFFEKKNLFFLIISHNQQTITWFEKSAMLTYTSGFPPFVKIDNIRDDRGDIVEQLVGKLSI